MTANRSTAVMQRRTEARDSLDDFPTPPWATRALCAFLIGEGHALARQTCREPAANRGHMVAPLRECFAAVEASDAHDYGAGFPVADYLFGPDPAPTDWTITNPPFRLAEDFAARALRISTVGVALLCRTAFVEGGERHGALFALHPPAFVLPLVERCCMLRGRLIRTGAPDPFNLDPETGEPARAATATAYAWFVWLRGERDTRLRWLAGRARHERPGDYPAYPEQWATARAARRAAAALHAQEPLAFEEPA